MAVSKLEIAYLCGLFDGEGSVTCRGHFVQLSITNTDRVVLDWVAERFGGRVSATRPSARSVRIPYRWRYSVSSWHLQRGLILSLISFSIIKRNELRIALRFLRECCSVKQRGRKLSPRQIAQRLWYKLALEEYRRNKNAAA